MEPDRHPEDAAELDMGFHKLPSTPQKAQKSKCVLRNVCARFLPGIQTQRSFCILYKL
jgi:hypothetical protein